MIREIWDYLMRRKLLLGLLLVVLALGGVLGAKIMANHRPAVSQAQEIGTSLAPTYNNSLTFRVPGKSGKPAYELVLASDFRSAKITVTAEALSSEAYVQILNPSGQVSMSEQTTISGGEVAFTNTPKSYSVQLGRGYMIEIHGVGVQVFSNLDSSLATAFMPSGATERYVLTSDGIRKSTWSDADGKTALYNLLKNYLVGQIEAYKAKVSDEILNNKHLDTAAKTRIIQAYRNLRGTDQAPYRDFINHLQRGGVPEITYSGQREYTVGDSVNFKKLVSVRDGEDGEYTMDQITVQSDVDFSQAGKYTLSYKASDSDRNTVTLKIPITVADAKPGAGVTSNNGTSAENSSNSNSSTSGGATVGGGMNFETGAIESSASSSVTWSNDVEAEDLLNGSETDEQVEVITERSDVQKNTDESAQNSGISASQIVLIILGIMLLIGLVRFIFDHYVR